MIRQPNCPLYRQVEFEFRASNNMRYRVGASIMDGDPSPCSDPGARGEFHLESLSLLLELDDGQITRILPVARQSEAWRNLYFEAARHALKHTP